MLNTMQSVPSGKTACGGNILLIAVCCFISVGIHPFGASVFSQNITNTLGTSGVFTIKDGSTSYLTLNQSTGQVNILNTLRLEYTTSSIAGVIFKGTDRFLHDYGTENTFLGINAGNFTMTGYQNTSFGNFSLNVNTTGFENTAEGNYSLRSNTLGNRNTSVGYASLYTNIMGNHNTALGNSSLFSNTGNFNTAVGSSSLFGNTTGSNNTAVGYQSLFSNTSFNNTTVGYQSLFSNTTGGNNTAVGYHALYSNIDGDQNTALGTRSLYSTTGNLNTAMGYECLALNTTGSSNTAIGRQALFSNTTGGANTAVGYGSGRTISTGSNLTCIGFEAQPTSDIATNQITLGNGFVQALRCNATFISSLSDMRDKKIITDLSLGLDFIAKLKPRQFNWDKREWYDDNISDGTKMKEEPTAGFIAQELDEAQTAGNAEWLNLVLKDNPEKWEATPGNLLPIMVKAIQELKLEKDIEIAKLKTDNDELKENNEKLSAEVASLKSMSEKLVQLEQMVNELTSAKHASLIGTERSGKH